ncbi:MULTISPECIES: LysR family transcriptional regulator [unclassified Bradyrhizobium]|uniref:LysR family transcriptional regulator n=1 Tax=unclassified Bradyrhizobium TaxID=2631580 RepID=UPI0028E7DC5D|nr:MULTISPECIES: LysR family transcriptional regulator [unclassified Bradyrhizobium]
MTITNISLAHLRVLSSVVDCGTFSAAATEIGLTQSGVSQSIKHLEAVLGGQLLIRHRDGIRITELGRAVLADARAALQAVERIRQTCSAVNGLLAGHIRIGSVSSVAARLLPARLAEFKRMYPRITVSLIEGTDAEVCEWVEKDIIDLGLTGETTPAVQPIVIMEDEFVVVVASDHRLASRGQISLTDAADEPFLMSASGCEPAIRQIFDQAKINPPIVLRVRDAEALVNMVSQDIGITIMPQLAIPADSRAIAQISIKPRRRRQVFAITRSGAPKVPAAERLKAMLSNTKG